MNIYIDFKSPAAYLAMRPTLALIEKTDADVTWLPFNTAQQSVPLASDDETKGDTHRRVRALSRQQTHLMYADLAGTDMHFRETPGSTELALAALLNTIDDRLDYILRAFQAYWVEQLDLNDSSVVTDLLGASGSVPDNLDVLRESQLKAENEGIIDTPAYTINGQLFIGREHLPWIGQELAKPG